MGGLIRRALLAVAVCAALGVASPSALAYSSLDNPPAGANNFNCTPSATHPNPVVLVHGLGATMSQNWGYLSPKLAARGYCVFALTYGIDPRWKYNGGVIPIEESAPELGAFVDKVLADTGAEKVDLVGHSEGTFMPQYWLKFLGGATKTDRYVALTPLYAGTTLHGVSTVRDASGPFGSLVSDQVAAFCGSCPQFLAGSPMVKKLNEGGAAVPGVQYTTIPTKYDELVTPYTSGILNAPNATNMVLQDVCPTDVSEHIAEAVDPVVAQIVFNALDPEHAAPVRCGVLPPIVGPSSKQQARSKRAPAHSRGKRARRA